MANALTTRLPEALVHLGLGECDTALVMLEHGLKERSRAMPFLHVDPMMDELKDNKRFNDILKRMNL